MLTIGVLAAEHIAVGLVNNHQLVGSLRVFPPVGSDSDFLIELPTDEIARRLAEQIEAVAAGQENGSVTLFSTEAWGQGVGGEGAPDERQQRCLPRAIPRDGVL